MLIIIYGEDTFRVQEKVKLMKQAFLEKFDVTGMNLAVFPSQGTTKLDPAEVLQAVCSYPFLGTKRMIVIGGLIEQTKKAEEALWLEGFSRMPDSTITILWETISPASLEKKKLFKDISALTDVHKYTFPGLEGNALSKWVSDRIRSRQGQIDSSALSELTMRVGSDLWCMSSEIEKLLGFAGSSTITREMVQQLVHASFESRIFDLIDALSNKQRSHALKLLQDEREAGSDDHYILTMLGRQVRILLATRAVMDANPRTTKQDIAQVTGAHPFVAQKALEQARFFSLADLKRVHDLLFEFDRNIKTGRMNAGLATDLVAHALLT